VLVKQCNLVLEGWCIESLVWWRQIIRGKPLVVHAPWRFIGFTQLSQTLCFISSEFLKRSDFTKFERSLS